MSNIEDLQRMLTSRSTDYGKMRQILASFLMGNQCEKKTLRNCDKFQDYDNAKEEWFHECCYWFGGCDGCGGTFTKRNGEPDFERWLFMPVNEDSAK